MDTGSVDTVGYAVSGHECGDYNTITFKNNVAHSIRGNGANIFRNKTSKTQALCIEASFFAAYKCSGVGIVSNQVTQEIIFSNMVLIDNGFSASANIGVEGKD